MLSSTYIVMQQVYDKVWQYQYIMIFEKANMDIRKV